MPAKSLLSIMFRQKYLKTRQDSGLTYMVVTVVQKVI